MWIQKWTSVNISSWNGTVDRKCVALVTRHSRRWVRLCVLIIQKLECHLDIVIINATQSSNQFHMIHLFPPWNYLIFFRIIYGIRIEFPAIRMPEASHFKMWNNSMWVTWQMELHWSTQLSPQPIDQVVQTLKTFDFGQLA